MKILMITSGYKGIYPYFEQALERECRDDGHLVRTVKPAQDQEIMTTINEFKPDVILTLVGFMMSATTLEGLKNSGAILCIWLTEDPFYIDRTNELVKDFDYVFTVDAGAGEYYRNQFPDKKIFFLPLGADTSLYKPTNSPVQYAYDVCIAGFPYPDRIRLVHEILNKNECRLIVIGPRWKRHIPHLPKERVEVINRWVAPELISNLFATTKIILNPHRAFNDEGNHNTTGIINKSINNKTFDIAASGSFQLIPDQFDLRNHFNPDEMIAYRDSTNCLELIDYYIDKDRERTQFSKKAYDRVLNCHTFFHRVQFILKQII